MPSPKPSEREPRRLATVGVIIYSRQYRNGILASLEGRKGLIPIDLGDGGEESLRRFSHVRPQVLLIDLPRERLSELLRTVRAQDPTIAMLAVNCDESEVGLLALFEEGLTGFVPHDATPDDLVQAVRDALAGEFHCPPRIAAALVRRVNAAGASGQQERIPARLSPREAQIARLLELSLTNKEIASRLGIEVATVRNHVYSICRKLDAHRRGEITARIGAPPLSILPRPQGPTRNR